jgi:mono/diheme cytochrome c family protein
MSEREGAPERAELERSTNRWMMAGLVLMGLFVLAFPLFRFYEPSQRAEARAQHLEFLAAKGAALFATSCEACHGVAGTGALAPAVGSKDFLESVDDRQLSQLIAVGIPGSEMVAYSIDFGGPLTSQEITAITTYLRSLEDEAPAMANWRTPLEDTSLSGQDLYVLACSVCHGVGLTGNPGLGYPDISQGSITQQESDEWIMARIADGYRGMPRFGRILTEDQIAAIVTFMRTGIDVPVTTTTTVPDTTTTTGVRASPDTDDVLALGELLFQELAGGIGCQACHGRDAAGAGASDITGASRSAITNALSGVIPPMDFTPRLTPDEIEAVYRYLLWLTGRDE